jgi:phosphoglycolate phosphatase-like HAD superfamily hydrolase
MQRKLLLFDIDGTLIRWKRGRSTEITRRLTQEVFKKHLPDGALTSFAGKTDLLIFKEIADFLSIPDEELQQKLPELQQQLAELCKEYISPEHIDLMPGVPELLKKLSENENIELALVTGNIRECAFLKLSSYGLDKYFSHGAFGCDHIERRRLPLIAIRRANEKHGEDIFKNNNSIIIGDSPRDIDCAHANGIPVVCVATAESTVEELEKLNAEIVLKDFSDLGRAERALTALI